MVKDKKILLLFAIIVVFIIHIPVSFGHKNKIYSVVTNPEHKIVMDSAENSASANLYDQLKLNYNGLSESAFKYAMIGYHYLKEKGKLANNQIISIVDFTKPSSFKRLFVLDLKKKKILFNTYVAHGMGSGLEMASHFSNTEDSYQSSLGFYKTSTTYEGKNGFSLKLIGLEYGFNSNAMERSIVMHGAPYVCKEYAQSQGYIGRSQGCPAVPEKMNKPIIERIKNGTCLFMYGANSKYLKTSKIINS